MRAVRDPVTSLKFYKLSHEWGHGKPSMPGRDDIILKRGAKHTEYGVMSHRIRTVMNNGTHLNAPFHLIQHGTAVGGISLDRCFGNGVLIDLSKSDVPDIENIAGDLDAVTGKRCTFMASPWRLPQGDGSAVRVTAIVDPDQTFCFESGRED